MMASVFFIAGTMSMMNAIPKRTRRSLYSGELRCSLRGPSQGIVRHSSTAPRAYADSASPSRGQVLEVYLG